MHLGTKQPCPGVTWTVVSLVLSGLAARHIRETDTDLSILTARLGGLESLESSGLQEASERAGTPQHRTVRSLSPVAESLSIF